MASKGSKLEVAECIICRKKGASRCAGCGKVAYCSKSHQKSHWKIHKANCQAWKIGESTSLGRYLTASRDIKAGDVILKECPLVLFPPRVTLPICLGCYSEFEEDVPPPPTNNEQAQQNFATAHPCPNNCGFPMCGSQNCNKSPAHEPECNAAWSRGGVKIRNFGSVHPTYEAIGILRVLSLKEKNPEIYSKLLSLKSHEENSDKEDPNKRYGSDEEESMEKDRKKNNSRTVALVQDFFRKTNTSKEEILKILSILETNGHEVPIPDENGQTSRHLIGVYHSSSFLEHNCVPNCVKTWDSSTNEHEIQIRASTPIKRGDHLSISYVDPMWGTVDRQHFLRMSKNFTCNCLRCIDPTELGTHFSSVRCQHGICLANFDGDPHRIRGLVIPTAAAETEEWKCNGCGELYSPAYVRSIVDKVGRELENLHEKYGDIEAEEAFVKKFSRVLSPNHFYLMEIKLGLAQIYGRTQDEPLPILPPKKLFRKLQICEELLNVFDKILPGYNRLRALILYERQAAMGSLTKMKRALEEISVERHKEELMICSKWLLEAIKVLGWEHENSIERKRADGGVAELEELKLLILNATHS